MNKTIFDVVHAVNELTTAVKELTKAVAEKELTTFEEIFNPETDLPAEAPTKSPQTPEKSKPKITKPDVRSCLSKLTKNGYTAEVQALLRRHGAPNLGGIDESEYEAIMEEAKSIGSET